jgi:hypothetical protein
MLRGLICGGLCVLAAAPAAAAKTVANTIADAGPALAGDTVVWGYEFPDGRAALLSRSPGAKTVTLRRYTAVHGTGHLRDFGGVPGAVSASSTRVAYALQNSVTRQTGSDTVSTRASVSPRLSVGGGPFINPLHCKGSYVSTAVEGDTVALGIQGEDACNGIWVVGHPSRRINATDAPRQVRAAGHWVAWLSAPGGSGDSITVADITTGAIVANFPNPHHTWQVFDLDAQGNIVAFDANKLVAFTITDPTQRVLARGAWSTTVATAGGRVAYVTAHNFHPDRLVVSDLSGHVVKRVDRYTSARRPTGEIALTETRIAWSVLRARNPDVIRGPGSVLTERL